MPPVKLRIRVLRLEKERLAVGVQYFHAGDWSFVLTQLSYLLVLSGDTMYATLKLEVYITRWWTIRGRIRVLLVVGLLGLAARDRSE